MKTTLVFLILFPAVAFSQAKRPNFYQDSAVIVHGDGHLDTVSNTSLATQDSLDRLNGIVPMAPATHPRRMPVAPSPFVDPRQPRPNDPPTRKES